MKEEEDVKKKKEVEDLKKKKEIEELKKKKEEVGKNEMKKNGNDYFFRWESERVCQTMKSAELKKFRIQDRIVLDSGRLSPELQSRTQDLEKLGVNTTVPITCMQCDTMFSRFLMTTDLDILCDFSVSAGLTIRRDVWGVEDFYSLVSGWEVRTKQAGGDLSGPASSQPALGLPGVGSGFGVEDDGQHQQHQQLWEEVVILNKDDCSMEVDEGGKDVAQGPVKAVTGKKSGKRMSAASRMSRSDRHSLRTYDELIEGRDEAAVAFPDDLDFQFLLRLRTSSCDESTPEVSGQVAGCRTVIQNFLLSFLAGGMLRNHIALIQVIVTPLYISTDNSDLPLDSGLWSMLWNFSSNQSYI